MANPMPEPDDDLRWLRGARDGDQEAGRKLVAAHGGSMMRTARSVLSGRVAEEVDDVVQEAFVAALTTGALPRGDVGAWLRAIVVRKALDQAGRTRRRAEDPLPEPGGATSEPAAPGDPHGPIDAITARRALAWLSPVDRAVLVLVDLEGRTMAETAAALGLTRVAVKLRASRARRRLARRLRGEVGPQGKTEGKTE